MAMVGFVVASVFEYVRGHFDHLAGVSLVPGTWPSERGGGSKYGGSGEYWERFRQGVLGVGVRLDHQTRNVRGHVSGTGRTLLDSSRHQVAWRPNNRRFHRAYVLWRRIWNHACLRGRLFWIEECRPDLRTHADCMGLRKCLWTAIDCLYAAVQRRLQWRSPRNLSHYAGLCCSSAGCLPT